MEKYRIIETKVPVLSSNTQGIVNSVPEIEYKSIYHVEELVIDKFLWMTYEDWLKVWFHSNYGVRDKFKSIEEAQKYIDYREAQIETNVVWKN